MNTLVIGIDARAAADVAGGRGRYVRELLRALATLDEAADCRFLLYARSIWEDPALDDRFDWQLIGARDVAWHVLAARRASKDAHVFLSTNSYLTAWFTSVPTAIVVYDLVPFESPDAAQSRASRIERATIRPALRRAAGLACISQATLDDLVRRFPIARRTARVIPLAADEAFRGAAPGDVASRFAIDRPYVLSVATLEPRKNLERLISAWRELDDRLRNAHALVLVGARGWEESTILLAARESNVHVLGHVTDDDLVALYAGARVFAYPSLYEGFGLPVLEAMSAGVPVITSNCSSLPEVAGDAALLVDPLDPSAIRDALARLLGDSVLATTLRSRGLAQAGRFSWAKTARETLELLRSIAADPRG